MQQLNKYLIWIGLVILVTGFFYDVMFAGIPYQDAHRDLLIEYNRNKAIAELIMIIGLITAGIGLIYKIMQKLLGQS